MRERVDNDVGVEGSKMVDDGEAGEITQRNVDEGKFGHQRIGFRQAVGKIRSDEQFIV